MHLVGWGESVSELMIVKKNYYKKLYTVLSCLAVFTFCTCCKILICLMYFVASLDYPVAAYDFFLVTPSPLSLLLPFLQ